MSRLKLRTDYLARRDDYGIGKQDERGRRVFDAGDYR
jgi:hypothetical protein